MVLIRIVNIWDKCWDFVDNLVVHSEVIDIYNQLKELYVYLDERDLLKLTFEQLKGDFDTRIPG